MPIKVTDTPNQNPQEDGAEDDQKERKSRYFPLIIPYGIETESENNLILVLYREEDDQDKDHHPKKCLHPFHFFRTPFLPFFLGKTPIKAE